MERKYGSKLFDNAPEDRKVMGVYFRKIASSKRFVDAIESGTLQRPKKNKNRVFDDLMYGSWDEYLVLSERKGITGAIDKMGLARAVFNILVESEYDFKLLDEGKLKGAFKTGDSFYEVGVSKMRTPMTSTGEVKVATKIPAHIEFLAEELVSSYDVIEVKSNKITLNDEDNGNTYSVNITKKKSQLF